MQGWGWQVVHDADELPRVLENWKAALAAGEPWEDTFPLRRHDGAMRWHLSRAEPLRNQQGEITCWFGTNTDITERLEMEEALREADRRKDEFLATLAHELRNPIAPISNALQIWPLVEDNPEEVGRLRTIMQSQVKQMTRLIDDLLDVSRITQGKIQLRCEPIDLTRIVAGAIEVIRPMVDSCQHRLEVELSAEPLPLDGDAARLTQAIDNVLQNATKYTPPGGAIRVSAAREGAQAVVTIQDNGIGIPQHMLARIFEVFQQGDQSLARVHGGLGLGLTLVKRLVELHGGTVAAHSAGEGQGSTFVVRLPLSESPHRRAGDPAEATRPAAAPPRRRVLVVDDVRASAMTLAMMLKSIGQETSVAHDGASAIEQILASQPDVVFLDIAMPGMSGYDVARHLRADPRTASLVLVALTGYGNSEDRRRASDAGFNFHITKPTSMDQLTDLLRALPAQQQQDAPSPLAD
jgi:signal transduction histidine kinase/CheY-like chemotaxis protein